MTMPFTALMGLRVIKAAFVVTAYFNRPWLKLGFTYDGMRFAASVSQALSYQGKVLNLQHLEPV
jgi:hypothetical protein